VATRREKIATIIKLAQIKPGETVIDLGSGDGRLLLASAQKGARAIGYEINPFLVLLTQVRTRRKSRGEVIIKRQNLWKANLSIANVVFVYGRKKTMQKFEDFVYKNAKKGISIVANTNPFPNKKPQKIENGIYLYKV